MINIISLGAGVQSSTMALMAAHGEIGPMPDAAIFADTGAEPGKVYDWLEWLELQLPFPVHRVSSGNMVDDIKSAMKPGGTRFASAPFFTSTVGGGSQGILRRQCTLEYKIAPIQKELRRIAEVKPRARPKGILVRQWVGISMDEAIRMKPNQLRWVQNVWPLIDKRMNRWDCKQWMRRHGYPEPPRSACTFCPYHSNSEWRSLRDNDPEGWNQAVEVDRIIRDGGGKTNEKLYVHRTLTPLEKVDLSTPEDHGQESLFGDECDGMCGT